MKKVGYMIVVGLFLTLSAGMMYADVPVPSSDLAGKVDSPNSAVGVQSDPITRPFKAGSPGSRGVLWDQYANWNSSDYAAQDFEAGYDIYDIWAADDFENTEPWQINTIVTRGGWGNYVDISNASAIYFAIYPDASGEPAGVPGDGTEYWSISLPPSDPQVQLGVFEPEDVVLTLSTPIPDLPAGTWWLVYQVSLEFGLYGQYGWSGTTDPVWGTAGMQNNPGGGFGLPAGWSVNSGGVDFMFRLEGSEVVPLACNGPKITFESGLPGPWTVLVNTGPVYWSTTDDLAACDNGGNQTSGSGEAACADCDQTNTAGVPYDTELWSSPFDLSGGYPDASLRFAAAYNDIGTGDKFEVWVWDGGSWNLELQWDEDRIETAVLDLSPYLGLTNVGVSFRYHGDAWDWWVQVDDVYLDCGAYIFGDGFESGNTTQWSNTVGYLNPNYDVDDGPYWGTNPPVYSCLDACALLFGGAAGDYQCSTSNTAIDNLANASTWGVGGCQIVAEDYKYDQGGGYDCGFNGCATSAYVDDNCLGGTNYCWPQ